MQDFKWCPVCETKRKVMAAMYPRREADGSVTYTCCGMSGWCQHKIVEAAK